MDIQHLKKSFYSWIVFFGTVLSLSIGYSALVGWLTTADKVSSGSGLTATSWNRIIDGVLDLDARTTSISGKFWTLTNGKWCGTDGTKIDCTNNVPTGPTGPTGATWPQWPTGATGPQWPQGIQWTAGTIIPTWAIMAFNLTTCPSWWSEYTAARGRFLRGLDNGSGNDPNCSTRTGGCTVGSTQGDIFGTHNHKSVSAGILNHRVGITGWPNNAWFADGGDGWFTTSTDGGLETRPKNVMVLYCVKT